MKETIVLFFTSALTALVLENVIFTRAFRIGRPTFFGGPRKILMHGGLMSLLTCLATLLSTGMLALCSTAGYPVPLAMRALLFLACVTVIYFILLGVLWRLPRLSGLLDTLPHCAFNCAVLGSLVLGVIPQRSLTAALGYALGCGVGYTLALLLLHTGRRRLELTTLPRAFKGMPITLLYIGIVSLAIYGLIGHQLPT